MEKVKETRSAPAARVQTAAGAHVNEKSELIDFLRDLEGASTKTERRLIFQKHAAEIVLSTRKTAAGESAKAQGEEASGPTALDVFTAGLAVAGAGMVASVALAGITALVASSAEAGLAIAQIGFVVSWALAGMLWIESGVEKLMGSELPKPVKVQLKLWRELAKLPADVIRARIAALQGAETAPEAKANA